jgi:hemerythrin-like domain-containing protein
MPSGKNQFHDCRRRNPARVAPSNGGMNTRTSRRQLLLSAAGLLLARKVASGQQVATPVAFREPVPGKPDLSEPSPVEDLMKEHGLLNRCMLVYETALDGLRQALPVRLGIFATTASLIHKYVEEHHERDEERFIFPRIWTKGYLRRSIAIILEQHQAGRRLTKQIFEIGRRWPVTAAEVTTLSASVVAFVRMYRHHAVHEDTVVFPALHGVLDTKGMEELGEALEAEEHRLLGEDGLGPAFAKIDQLERELGIDDLATFTPRFAQVGP